MNSLKVADWREKIDRLADALITSEYTDAKYFENKDHSAQTKDMKEIYDLAVSWGQLDIMSIMGDVEDHDYDILEEMAELIMENCGEMGEMQGSYDDIRASIMNELYSQYGISVYIEFPVISLTSLPYSVVKELMDIGGYYEMVYPPPGSWQEYIGKEKQAIGYNDAQNILFENLVRFDMTFDASSNDSIPVPVIVRPIIKPALRLRGEIK